MTELFDIAADVYRELASAELKAHGRHVTVPSGTVGFTVPAKASGDTKLVPAGESVKSADGDLQLVRATPFEVDLPPFEVASADGFSCRVVVRVGLAVDTHEPEAIHDFVRAIAAGKPRVFVHELAELLAPDVTLGIKKFAAGRTVETLHEHELAEPADPLVQSALRKFLLSSGLVYHGVHRLLVVSPEYEKLQKQAAAARKQEVVAQKRQRMRELWEKDRRRELLSRHEIEEFIKTLEHEGLVSELDRKREALSAQESYDQAFAEYQKQQHDLQKMLDALEAERQISIDRMRFEERLSQAKRAHETLKGASLEFFISTLDDESEKARLYRQLIAKEMTPEQIANLARSDGDIEQIMEKVLRKIEELLDRGAESGRFKGVGQKKQDTHRVLVVVGKTILAYDPRDYRTVERPNETYDVSRHNLGSLRAVRVDQWRGQPVILAGARQGCYVINADTPTNIREHAFFTDSVHKGGTNSAVIVGDYLFGAHSEQGLCRWPLDDPSYLSVPMFREFCAKYETTRSLTTHDGLVFFATGGLIAAFHPETIDDAPSNVWKGGGREVTGIIPYGDDIFAGNRDGQLLRWSFEDGTAPEVVQQEQSAIYMVKQGNIGGLPHLVIGSKAYGVTVKSLQNQSLTTRYQAEEQIRWVDGAADYVVGVSADQSSLYIWQTHDPQHPIRKITPGDKIQDVVIWHK